MKKKIKDLKNNLMVFKPKIISFNQSIKTDTIPLSHTAYMNIDGLKSSYFKDSPVCLDLEYYQPKIKQKIYFLDISGSSLHFFK